MKNKKFTLANFFVIGWILNLSEQDIEEESSSDKNGGLAPTKIDFAVGGQAVIEGVMMRSPSHLTVVVRQPDNNIVVKTEQFRPLTQRFSWLNVPIIRGLINLFEMMVVGTKAINYSAEQAFPEENTPAPKVADETKSKLTRFVENLSFGLSFVIGLGISLFLFKALPLWITTYLETKSATIQGNYLIFNTIDGLCKITIFLTYIYTLSLIPSFRRIFEYHGAEHKSIFTYERGLAVNVENSRPETRFHPRCGTSFILIVFLMSIAVYTFVPKSDSFITTLLTRVAFLPLIAGISYEYLKFSAKNSQNVIVKALIQPGLWLQKITTKEPSDLQLEVGNRSLNEALAAEAKA